MIKLMKSTFYNEKETKKKLCDFIMKSSKLSMGEKCKEFEEKFAEYQGRKHAVFYNSGSSANLALIQSLLNVRLINKGDNVGFSDLTWATNVMPLVELGLSPIPIDISLETLNVTSKTLGDSTENLKALFLTNLLGFSGDIENVKGMCEEKNILLIEDNCESLGSEFNGIKLGNFGLASTFSFFVGHHLSTIEGGMVCTNDEKLYEMLIMVRSHGWNRNLSEETKDALRKKHKVDKFHDGYTFYAPAYNLRPTEIMGFIGCEQLKYIEEINNKRNQNFFCYQNAISQNPDFQKLDITDMTFVSNFAYPIICKDKETFNKYKEKFSDVEIRPIVGGSMSKQPFYLDIFPQRYKCPNAEKIHEVGFYIPNNPELTGVEIEKICNLLK